MFKKLTAKNWNEHDSTSDIIVRINDHGQTEAFTGDDWAKIFFEPQLSRQVPKNICDQFEVARGALCYGWYFYPLYTLGTDQLFRVVESALFSRCAQLDAPKTLKTFRHALDWLISRDVISREKKQRWEAVIFLRNEVSHAKTQHINDPTSAARTLSATVDIINGVFER